MKKKKLALKDISVSSFVTEKQVKGGQCSLLCREVSECDCTYGVCTYYGCA